MSKKKKVTVEAKEKRDLTKFCSFWTLAVSAILYIVSGLIRFITWLLKDLSGDVVVTLNKVCGIFQFLGNLALIIAIALPAYAYVKNKSRFWKIFYVVCLVIFIFGIVFTVLPVF